MERYELTEAQKNELSGKSFDEIADADSEFISKSLLDPNATQHYNPEVIRLLIQKAVSKNNVVNADVDAHFASLETLGKAIKSMETKSDYIAGINNLRNLGSPQNPINGTNPPSVDDITNNIRTPDSNSMIDRVRTPNVDDIADNNRAPGSNITFDRVQASSASAIVDGNGQIVGDLEDENGNASAPTNEGASAPTNRNETDDSATALVVILIVIFILILPILIFVFVLKGIRKTLTTDDETSN